MGGRRESRAAGRRAAMARWLRDRLLLRGGKPPPPQPDYAPPPEQPDLVAAYRLQRERDFEDPYAAPGAPSSPGRRSSSRRLVRPGQRPQDQTVALEDYADPFDTETAGEPDKVKNEGYMEPYEAQKILAVQKRDPDDSSVAAQPLHLYDTPYEVCEREAQAESEHLPGIPFRYSWLPEDDERPPEEYDQPWEWKKDRISRVFAVEIEGIKELPWPPPVGQLDSMMNHLDEEGPPDLQSVGTRCPPAESPPSLRNTSTDYPDSVAGPTPLDISSKGVVKSQSSSGTEKRNSLCWLSVEPGLTFGERVNPTLPLESQAWYHGTLSRVDAEGLLRLCREASYLVRNSESIHNAFSLSLKSSQGFLHMKLLPTEDKKFILGQHSPPFDNVPEIIHHYASHKLPIQGAEHMTLLYPVVTRSSSCLAAEQ
ncbi:SH2 domain-containing adapter protein F isoform X2 [Paroedura picta]|uniref:SH2 domain-containing adapter protein F isoform X2 n=1 Tax=Paroedura picta TaxID=143630 RepID=UPI0040565FA6